MSSDVNLPLLICSQYALGHLVHATVNALLKFNVSCREPSLKTLNEPINKKIELVDVPGYA